MQNLLHKFFQGFRGKEGGYALLTALVFFLTASAAVVAGISDAVFRETKIVRNETASKQSYFLAESGAEDVVYRIQENLGYDSSETYSIGESTTVVTVGSGSTGDQEIVSTGDAGGTQRTVTITTNPGSSANFSFALQGGLGGIHLDGGATIEGDVYTTGSVSGCGSCTITGNVIAAGKSNSVVDQENSLPSTPTASMSFGSSKSTQDFAQSFQVSTALSLVDIEFYIKKVGSPSNATVRVTTDNSGKPSNTILTSGTLSSSLLSTSYEWERISLTANPILTPGTTYWVVIDSYVGSDYYVIAANNTINGHSYPLGSARYGNYGNGSWISSPPPGLDGYFKINIGENEDGITGEDQWNQLPVSSAYSYESSYVNAAGDLYCQIGTDNNKPCDTSRGDPVVQEFPMTDELIQTLKNKIDVSEGNVYVGDYVATNDDYIYGKKIEGNLTISNGRRVNIGGIVWVTGNVTINGGAEITNLGGDSSSIIIADGSISLTNGAEIMPNEYGDGQIIFLSTMGVGSTYAVTVSGGAEDTVVFAPNGEISISGGARVTAAAAHTLYANGGATITYDPRVSNMIISNDEGVSESSIKSWKETE